MWKLHYNSRLILFLENEETEAFLRSGFYKLSLKRFVKEAVGNEVRFKDSMNYLDFKRIIALCERDCAQKKRAFIISDSLRQYIEEREMYIEIRSRLGIELKNRETKLTNHFEEYRAVVNGSMARKLRERQMWDSFFMCTMKKSANFSVPGSGKTASVLGVYAYLRQKGKIKKLLVICPKNAFGSWMDEFHACFDGIEPLSVMNIHAPQYKTARQRRAALQYDSGSCNMVLINYEALGNLLESAREILDGNTLLVFDEVHKVKLVDGEYAANALELACDARYVIAMTGTPLPNSYVDIYNLLHILYPDEYDEFFGFNIPVLRNPNDQDIEQINDKLQPFFCRTTKQQLGVPPVNEDCFNEVSASAQEQRLFEILKMKYKKKPLALLVRILQLESNPRLLLKSLDLKDFAYLLDDSVDVDEIDFADYSDEVQDLIRNCETSSKFRACIRQVQTLTAQNKTAVVWCMFVDSIRELAHTLQMKGIRCQAIYGEVPLEERLEILSSFKNGNIQVLITNPHTLAESVSLHTVCHDAIYFEYSYNLVHLLQSKDRIHRLGLPEGQYTQYYYMQQFYKTEKFSLGKEIYDRLKEKERMMLDAIDRHQLESLPTCEEDLQLIFQKLY